jgi:radical SAM protein with 4Fe4S-binding SPASM domain
MEGYDNSDMSIEIVKKYVILAAELGADSVVLIGGEPTMHPNFFKIIEIIKLAGLKVFLATNGIKFSDKEFLKKSIDADISSVAISFKAANRQMFLEETGRDLFYDQVKAIQSVFESGMDYIVSITACDNQMNNFDEMLQAVKNTKTKRVFIDTGMPIFSNGKSVVDEVKSPKEVAKFIMEAYPKLEKSGLSFTLKLGLPFCLFTREFIEKIISDGNTSTRCQMRDKGSLIIDSDGNILPCNHLCDLSLGTIGKNFTNAREFKNFRNQEDIIRFYQEVNSCSNKQCVNCQYWNICGSGCKIYWLHYKADSLLGDFSP